MIVWVDADSCPKPVRELVFKTGNRLKLTVKLVANHPIALPPNPLFEMVIAANTPDAADDHIVEHAVVGDLAITRDIPLAKRLVDAGVTVINDRGVEFTEINIHERLSTRNLMLELYNLGIAPERTGQFGKKEAQEFANALDRTLTRLRKAT